MDWRRLRVLVKGLPAEGTALAREMHGVSASWSTTDWLLERIANVVQDGVWGFFEANRDREKQPREVPRPEPIRLPRTPARQSEPADGMTPQGKRIASSAETARLLRDVLNPRPRMVRGGAG